MGTSCLTILIMIRSVLALFWLTAITLGIHAEVVGDETKHNELKQLWSTFKFPENTRQSRDSSGDFVGESASQEGRSYQPDTAEEAREPRNLGGYVGLNLCGGYGGGFGGGYGGGYGGGLGYGGNQQQVLYSLQYLASQLVEYVGALQGGNIGGFGGNYGGFGGNYGGIGGGFGGGLWRSGRNYSEFGREGGEAENVVEDDNEGVAWGGGNSFNNV